MKPLLSPSAPGSSSVAATTHPSAIASPPATIAAQSRRRTRSDDSASTTSSSPCSARIPAATTRAPSTAASPDSSSSAAAVRAAGPPDPHGERASGRLRKVTRPDETGLVTDQSSLEVEPLDDLEDAPGAPRALPRAATLPRTLFGGSDVQGLREREDRLLVQAERSQQRAAKHVQICHAGRSGTRAVVAAHVDLVIQESDRRAVEPGFLRDPGASEQHVEAQWIGTAALSRPRGSRSASSRASRALEEDTSARPGRWRARISSRARSNDAPGFRPRASRAISASLECGALEARRTSARRLGASRQTRRRGVRSCQSSETPTLRIARIAHTMPTSSLPLRASSRAPSERAPTTRRCASHASLSENRLTISRWTARASSSACSAASILPRPTSASSATARRSGRREERAGEVRGRGGRVPLGVPRRAASRREVGRVDERLRAPLDVTCRHAASGVDLRRGQIR